MAGLLHELGDLIVGAYMPEAYASILQGAVERGCRTFEVEEERLGFSHAEIGAYLLGIWGLPQPIVDAVAHHHHPTRMPHSGFDPMTAVYVADLLAGRGPDSPILQHDQDCLEELGLTQKFAEWRKTLPFHTLAAGA